MKNNNFNNAIEFLFTIASYQFFKNDWIFVNHGLFSGDYILNNSTLSIFVNK